MHTKTALLLIDIQLDYFEEGAFPLDPLQRERAVDTAAHLLSIARNNGILVVHVQHERDNACFLRKGTPGTAIHPKLAPLPDEIVVKKEYPNSFRKTGLEEILRDHGIQRLVVGGMIAWMCVQSTVRAANDLGFDVRLVPDMVASREIAWHGIGLSADQTFAAAIFPLTFRFAKDTSTMEAEQILSKPRG